MCIRDRFEGEEGSPEKSQIVFNTPIVLYTHASVAEVLTAEGVFSQSGGVLTADMEQLVELMESGAQWSDVGPVSYTHLDVYKRQVIFLSKFSWSHREG